MQLSLIALTRPRLRSHPQGAPDRDHNHRLKIELSTRSVRDLVLATSLMTWLFDDQWPRIVLLTNVWTQNISNHAAEALPGMQRVSGALAARRPPIRAL
jgi:hypothetical protein